MERITEESIKILCEQIVAYFNVDNIDRKTTVRPKPRKVSFIKKLVDQWTSDGILMTEEFANSLEGILDHLDKKNFNGDAAKSVIKESEEAMRMVGRYLNIVKFFDLDDMIARKFVNNAKTMEHDLEEIIERASKTSAKK